MIKIITVFNSLNPGSFLQATALYETIRQRYGEVAFLNIKARQPLLSGIKVSIRLLQKGRFLYALKQLSMPFLYSRKLKEYKIATALDQRDIYILGSDEIWNLSRKDITRYPVLWGSGLDQSRSITYAPSVNDASSEDVSCYPDFINALKNLRALSVRDSYSQKVLKGFTEKKITTVCDPVLLLPIETYRKKYSVPSIKARYIMVYGPERHFTKAEVNKIVEYARKNDFKLIAYYFQHTWVDEVYYGDPYEFLQLIDGAECVFTSTFHGTMFSVLYQKQFLIFGENQKVQEVLKQFDLSERWFREGNVAELLHADCRYELVNRQINDLVIQSKQFLFNAIDQVMDQANE